MIIPEKNPIDITPQERDAMSLEEQSKYVTSLANFYGNERLYDDFRKALEKSKKGAALVYCNGELVKEFYTEYAPEEEIKEIEKKYGKAALIFSGSGISCEEATFMTLFRN